MDGGAATCQNDVGDVAMATVVELLRVLQAAPREAHHGRLCVVEGGALAEKARRTDGTFNHVELLQLKSTDQICEAEQSQTQLRPRLVAVLVTW